MISFHGGPQGIMGSHSVCVCFPLYLNVHTCVTQKLGLATCFKTNWGLIQSHDFIVVQEELKLPIFDSLTH